VEVWRLWTSRWRGGGQSDSERRDVRRCARGGQKGNCHVIMNYYLEKCYLYNLSYIDNIMSKHYYSNNIIIKLVRTNGFDMMVLRVY